MRQKNFLKSILSRNRQLLLFLDVDEKVGIMPFCHDRYLGSNPDISQKSKKVLKAKKGKHSCPKQTSLIAAKNTPCSCSVLYEEIYVCAIN